MPEFSIYLFGPPRIERDGESLHISRRKSVALLAYLAVTNQPHSRDMLATLFWPEMDATTSRANLRRILSGLNQLFGEVILVSEGDQVSFNRQTGVWLDIAEFESRLNQARVHEHGVEAACPACQSDYTEAAALYTGDFLSGFSLPDSPGFDEWQFFQSEELRRRLAEALQWLIRWHTDQQEYERSLDYARRWLALDPLHEPAHRQLMQLYAQSGQFAAAARQYQECVRLLKEELGVEPEAETHKLYEAIKGRRLEPPDKTRDRSPAAASPALSASKDYHQTIRPDGESGSSKEAGTAHSHLPGIHSLPLQLSPTVGREEELSTLDHLLRNEPSCRLLTLTGPGGSGKTHLAIQAARNLAEQHPEAFPDGVWFVPLTPLEDLDILLLAIAKTFDFSSSADQQVQGQLLDYLHPKQMLILLDNIEHLVCQDNLRLISDIVALAPEVKFLVTSRVPLNIRGEQLFPVSGLKTPPADHPDIAQEIDQTFVGYGAIQFFQQCAARFQPNFRLAPDLIPGIVRICRLVHGLPLGIELAAAWLPALSPVEIAAEIERCLDFLEADWHDVPDRQRSMRAVFDSSWTLLDQDEREALQTLTVFPGSFSRQAAESVAQVSVKTLLGLVSKSLVQHDASNRFHLHELLRQYGAEKLQADLSTWRQVKDRHSLYYANFLHQQEAVLKGDRQKEALQSITVEMDNIRSAWQWQVESHGWDILIQRILPALFRYSEEAVRSAEFLRLLEMADKALALEEETNEQKRSLAIIRTSQSTFLTNGYPVRYTPIGLFIPAHDDLIRQSWSLALETGSLQDLGLWGVILAYHYGRFIDQEVGVSELQRLMQYFKTENQQWELAFTIQCIGCLLLVQSYRLNTHQEEILQEAKELLSESLSIFQDLGDKRETAYTLIFLSRLLEREKNIREAISHLITAQKIMQEIGEWVIALGNHMRLGDYYVLLGEFEEAFRYYQENSQENYRRGYYRDAAYSLSNESYHALRYSSLEHARRTREQALALTRKAGDLFGEAWSTWEMGEVLRVSGEALAARQWYEQAKPLFEKTKEVNGPVFYHRGLGDLAQAEGDYQQAWDHFQKSLEVAREINHRWASAYALSGLGRAALGLMRIRVARECFSDALEEALRDGDPGIALVAVQGFASLYGAEGKDEMAALLGAFVLHHRQSWQETKNLVSRLLASLQLSPEQLAAANERGRELELLELANHLLEKQPQTVRQSR